MIQVNLIVQAHKRNGVDALVLRVKSALRNQAAWGLSVAMLWCLGMPISAQQRPLLTEDPETIGAGLVLVEAGVDWFQDQAFLASGLSGDLLRLPTFGMSFGISSIAEIQLDGGLNDRLSVTDRQTAPLSGQVDFQGDHTRDFSDLIIATKVRLFREADRRPALGIRFATRLPNASNETGLGLDTTDFYVSALMGKTARSVRVVGNVGLGILGDPIRGDRQNDVVLYGLSVARAMVKDFEIVGGLSGHVSTRTGDPPAGTESRGRFRFGSRFTRGPARIDAAVVIGITKNEPAVGLTAGFTYVFSAFQVP